MPPPTKSPGESPHGREGDQSNEGDASAAGGTQIATTGRTGTSSRRSTPVVALWAARLLWLVVAAAGGAGFGDALSDRPRAVQLTGTVLLWVGWAAVAAMLALPGVIGLTLSRTVVPAGAVVAVAATVARGLDTSTAVTMTTTALATLVVASGEFGEAMVQASAYGHERRFLLTPPAAFYVPTAVSWMVLVAAAATGPLLLAARNWVVGVPVTAIAAVVVWFLPTRFHRLSRRWLVLVPAGVVIHDHVVLGETVMLRDGTVRRIRLALADTQAADLTGPAGGHAIEITVAEPVGVVFAGTRQQPNGRAIHARGVLVAPTRPGRVLAAAAERLPVG